ncbi:MAG: helix-turn-helix transcriptional regulator [Acidobacteriota bacterium]
MEKKEFIKIRKDLEKTQKEIAVLLGVSLKTIESYEQGLRNIPPNVERILYYLFFKLNKDKIKEKKMCWDETNCPAEIREKCIAWSTGEGYYCWFITGKTCYKQREQYGIETIPNCFHCPVFKIKLKEISE